MGDFSFKRGIGGFAHAASVLVKKVLTVCIAPGPTCSHRIRSKVST
jgi:hypothetical protein